MEIIPENSCHTYDTYQKEEWNYIPKQICKTLCKDDSK